MIACDMAVVHPRDALVALADREGDVAEGALWIAAEDTSGLDVARWHQQSILAVVEDPPPRHDPSKFAVGTDGSELRVQWSAPLGSQSSIRGLEV